MDENLVVLVLAVLIPATALNLFLVLRLAAIVRPEAAAGAPPTFPIGETVPPFEGRRRADGTRLASATLAGQAVVLIFLSSGCATCREKVAELVRIVPGARRAGVALWIVPPQGGHDLPAGIADSPLREHVLEIDAATARLLNPANALPFYLFIDDRMIVQASHYVGDENWRLFVDQMGDASATLPVPC